MLLERRFLHDVNELEWNSLIYQICQRILQPTHIFHYENLIDEHFYYHGIRLLPCMVLTKRERHLFHTVQKVHASCFELRQGTYYLKIQVEF